MTETPNSINELVLAGEFGFRRIEGPWAVEKSGTMWTIVIPDDAMSAPLGHRDEGTAAVLIADGVAVGGGIVTDVVDLDGEDEQHVVVDQYFAETRW